MKKLGLIAGNGELPRAVAREAREKGYRVYAAALEPLADPALADDADEFQSISVGKLGELIEYLQRSGVTEAVMAGKVPKTLLYKSRIVPDLRAIKLLFTLKDRSDDSILLAITNELLKEGITILNTTEFTSNLLVPEGIISKRRPTEREQRDIRFGWNIAKEIGRLDIGQTIVVKDQAVMAVEAIEGTDEAIRRGGALAGEGAVVIKVSKPFQDMRFDVPVVGMNTLQAMIESRARVLAVEAQKSLLLQRQQLVREAAQADICIVGMLQNQEAP